MTVRRTHEGSLALHAVSCAVLIVAGTGLTLAGNGNDDDHDHDNDNDDLLVLIGIVRDFTPDHPDFDVSPPQGSIEVETW